MKTITVDFTSLHNTFGILAIACLVVIIVSSVCWLVDYILRKLWK